MAYLFRVARLAAALVVAALAAPLAGARAADVPATSAPVDVPAAGAAKGGIRWIADDWPRALAEARSRDALVVVDAWAPW